MILPRYVELFRSRGWIVFFAALICAVASYGVSTHVLKKKYTATATFEVNIPSSTINQNLNPPGLVATDSQLITTYPVAEQAIKNLHLGPGWTPDGVTNLVSCTPADLATTFTCKLTYGDPVLASRLLNELGTVAIAANKQNSAAQLQPLLNKVSAAINRTQNDLAATEASQGPLAAARAAQDQTTLALLQQQQTSWEEALAAQTNSIIPIDPARVPTDPSSPRPLFNAVIAGFLGLLLGIGGVLVADYLDDSPRSADHLSEELGAPVFATLPRVQRKAGQVPEVLANPQSESAEAFRILRTSIRFANVDAPIRSLLVTSAAVSEGKTTVAANLAITFAQAGVRVVLIDADLRRPNVHKVLHLDNTAGLTSVLSAQEDVQWATVLQPGPVPRLQVLTAGPLPPNPAELLSSRRMRRVMDHLRERADLILVDSPPLLAVADPQVLSLMTDAVLLVSDVEQTSLRALRRSADVLAAVGTGIAGVALNKVPRGKANYYHYYGDGYHSNPIDIQDAERNRTAVGSAG